MLMTIDSFSALDCLELHPKNTDSNYSFIVDGLTGEIEKSVQNDLLGSITDHDGILNHRGMEYFGIDSRTSVEHSGDFIVEGTFRGGRQSVIPKGLTLYGGNQVMSDATLGGAQIVDESIERHEIRFLRDVLSEIFDGRYDLAEIDREFLLNPDSGMPQTLRSLFINKPGHNGGKSSIRHIFRGDKSGGLHVPAFAPELARLYDETLVYPFAPFEAIVSINGVSKLKLVNDGTPRLEPAKTSMFPTGLDSLAVMQCIIDAWEHKGDWKSVLISESENITKIYEVPVMVDDAPSPMNIRLVTDSGTYEEKIRTAFPVVATN